MIVYLVRWGRRISPTFLLCVVLPTLVAIAYFGFLATDVYVSESRFVIHNPDKPQVSTLGLLLNSASFAHGSTESNAAESYLQSRDALAAINRDEAYRKAYGRSTISVFDRFDAFRDEGSFEDLYKYYLRHIKVDSDTSSSIVTLTVRAFNAEDAQHFNESLLRLAENTVNGMSERERRDLIATSAAEVLDAKREVRDAGVALALYRNRSGVVDPEKQAPVQLEMISKLQDDLIETLSQRRELAVVAPQNDQIPVLDVRAQELKHQIDAQSGLIAGDRNKSLAATAEQYERLQLETGFADKRLTAALASLQEAEIDAQHKNAYVERIVRPNRPDKAIEPRRVRGILTTLLFSLIFWGVIAMLIAGIREHRS